MQLKGQARIKVDKNRDTSLLVTINLCVKTGSMVACVNTADNIIFDCLAETRESVSCRTHGFESSGP